MIYLLFFVMTVLAQEPTPVPGAQELSDPAQLQRALRERQSQLEQAGRAQPPVPPAPPQQAPPLAPSQTEKKPSENSDSPPPVVQMVDEGGPSTTANEVAPEQEDRSNLPTNDENIDPSDRNREARFARIYEKFGQTEIDSDEWKKIAGEKTSESYNLQRGDTLWDISNKFFGSGFYWPKVWQLNDKITNPHSVRRTDTLQFDPGNAVSAPRLSVKSSTSTEIDEEVPEEEILPIVEGSEIENERVAIPRAPRSKPVLNKIPNSFPDWTIRSGNYDKEGFAKDIFVNRAEQRHVPSPIPSIIAEEPWESVGEVIEMEGMSSVAATYQNIIIQLDTPAQSGDLFTVFSDNGRILDPVSGSTVGYEVQTKAEVKILEAIEGTSDKYRALVVFAALPVSIGNSVKPGRGINRSTFELDGTFSSVAARIVNGEFNKRRLMALHNIVYLNRGSEDGLQTGALLNVIKNVSLRNENTVVRFDPRPIAVLKVVDTEKHVSTAVVVAERDPVMPGDETSLVAANTVNILDENTEKQFEEKRNHKFPKSGSSPSESEPQNQSDSDLQEF